MYSPLWNLEFKGCAYFGLPHFPCTPPFEIWSLRGALISGYPIFHVLPPLKFRISGEGGALTWVSTVWSNLFFDSSQVWNFIEKKTFSFPIFFSLFLSNYSLIFTFYSFNYYLFRLFFTSDLLHENVCFFLVLFRESDNFQGRNSCKVERTMLRFGCRQSRLRTSKSNFFSYDDSLRSYFFVGFFFCFFRTRKCLKVCAASFLPHSLCFPNQSINHQITWKCADV